MCHACALQLHPLQECCIMAFGRVRHGRLMCLIYKNSVHPGSGRKSRRGQSGLRTTGGKEALRSLVVRF